jgi:hypothetical protein
VKAISSPLSLAVDLQVERDFWTPIWVSNSDVHFPPTSPLVDSVQNG